MPALNTDKFAKATATFSTTLNGGISSGATTITLNSVSGLPTDTAVILTIDATDANGTATPATKEVVLGVVSGSTITNVTRGVEGTQQAHSSGAVVVDYVTAKHWNNAMDALLVGHTQLGAHAASLPLTTPQITTSINDANGNEVIKTPATASAVNEFTTTNAATGNKPKLSATGGDTDIGIDVQPKGAGILQLLDGNGNEVIKTAPAVASAVNEVTVANAATGTAPSISATGGDTNINLKVAPKGTGYLQLGGIEYQDLTTNSVKANVVMQSGWSFINNDGSEASGKAITFPVAFDTVLSVVATLNGEKNAAADPTAITDGADALPTDTIQATLGTCLVSTTGFTVLIKRVAAASGKRDLFSWIAIGIKA